MRTRSFFFRLSLMLLLMLTAAAFCTAEGAGPADSAAVGSYIVFGSCEQDGNPVNGPEPIEWLVLDRQDDRLLVISRYALDSKPYNDKWAGAVWEDCTLRAWLNDDFFSAAFTDSEQAMIPTVTVPADKNPSFPSVNAGSATQDKLFLLSIPELEKYLPTNSSMSCEPTAYAVLQGVDWTPSTKNPCLYCVWWLRTPGMDSCSIARVNFLGGVLKSGDTINAKDNAVRPAMWIDLTP